MHVTEIVRLPVVSHIILNVCTESAVESMAKGIVAIANLGGILIELNHVFDDLASVALMCSVTGSMQMKLVSRSSI